MDEEFRIHDLGALLVSVAGILEQVLGLEGMVREIEVALGPPDGAVKRVRVETNRPCRKTSWCSSL
jgi:hypothetical protein